jgi:hypothetical protein
VNHGEVVDLLVAELGSERFLTSVTAGIVGRMNALVLGLFRS